MFLAARAGIRTQTAAGNIRPRPAPAPKPPHGACSSASRNPARTPATARRTDAAPSRSLDRETLPLRRTPRPRQRRGAAKCQARSRYRAQDALQESARRRRSLHSGHRTSERTCRHDRLYPARVIAAAIIWLAYRYMGLRVWQAVVCLIFGFLLAATTAAPEIRNLLTGLVQWLTKP